MSDSNWVRGDLSGLDIPADAKALETDAPAFLTRAFRASGVLSGDNRIAVITEFRPFSGGGTGSKLLLAVEYAEPDPKLDRELFVKFSRNFDDPIRDSVRHMLKPEIEFAALSRAEGFPIIVPECYFADFDAGSGTGLLVTRRIPYGRNGIEPQHIKCMDHEMESPLEHYLAIMKALGRLAGTHKAGKLPGAFYRDFTFDPSRAIAEDPLRYRGDKLARRLTRLAEFIGNYPRLFPANIRAPGFIERFRREAPEFVAVEQSVRRYLFDKPEFVALCHWNANIDNAWFWRNGSGELVCGLMDWGAVGQMNVAKSIYGAFSGADTGIWNGHLAEVLEAFAAAFENSGGPEVDRDELEKHTLLFVALMGIAYLMDAPAILEKRLPALADLKGPRDDRLLEDEDSRVQLHMLTMFLNQWETRDIGGLVKALNFKRDAA